MKITKALALKFGSNIISIGIYQLSNFLFQIAITPFLINRVGLERFGIITTGVGVATILTVICDYGFVFTATRDISQSRTSKKKVGLIITKVLSFKFILIIAAFVVQLILLLFHNFSEYSLFYFLSFFLVAGKAFFPNWYFQGVERMHFLGMYSIISKLISFVLLYIIVTSPRNFLYVNFIIGAVDVVVSALALFSVFKQVPFRLQLLTKGEMVQYLKQGGYFFLSSLFIIGYTGANTVLLSFFIPSSQIGSYAVAERIIFIFKTIPYLFFQAIYPYACELQKSSLQKLRMLAKHLFLFLTSVFAVISLFVFVFSEKIVVVFSKEDVYHIAALLRIVSAVPLMVAVNSPAYLMLVVTKRQQHYFKLIVTACILNVLLNVILIPQFQLYASAFSLFFSEFFIAASLHILIQIKFNDINFLRNRLTAQMTYEDQLLKS